ncbi:MAG: hypothetical protein ACOYD4_17745, partial [Solirubrobacterales bacterium]
ARELGGGRREAVASLDTLPRPGSESAPAAVADMQTAALLGAAEELGVALAALLIVAELGSGERLGDEPAAQVATAAGRAAAAVLSG